jgi:DNA-binding transcriptional regulator YhcF (GntR family)
MKLENRTIEVRNIEDSEWYWIPRIVFENYTPKIGVIGLALYNAYSSYARDKGVAFPSQKTLAEKLRLSIKTIIKYNKILEANGLIKIERRRGRTNLVTLLKIGDVKQVHTPPVTDSVEVVKEVQTKENNMKENTIEVDDRKSSIKEIFDYFKNRVKAVKGFVPEIDWGKDGKLIKKRLERYSTNEVKDLIEWYLNSPYSDRLGCSLSICLSTNLINLWKANRSINLEKLYPSWQSRN